MKANAIKNLVIFILAIAAVILTLTTIKYVNQTKNAHRAMNSYQIQINTMQREAALKSETSLVSAYRDVANMQIINAKKEMNNAQTYTERGYYKGVIDCLERSVEVLQTLSFED